MKKKHKAIVEETTEEMLEDNNEEKLDNKSDNDVKSYEEATSNKSDDSEETIESADDEELFDEEEASTEKKRKKKKNKKKKPQKKVNIVKELLSLIIYIGAVMLVCFLLLKYVGSRSVVDGTSMNPTLENNDSIWVDKLTYRFHDPKRFDIIVFDYDEDTTYVKRIIGLPGETVRIDQNGTIFINEKPLEEHYGKEVIYATNIGRASQPILLGSDEYFVLGDNRNNSSDSRFSDVGNIKREDIVGRVRLRLSPIKSFGKVN